MLNLEIWCLNYCWVSKFSLFLTLFSTKSFFLELVEPKVPKLCSKFQFDNSDISVCPSSSLYLFLLCFSFSGKVDSFTFFSLRKSSWLPLGQTTDLFSQKTWVYLKRNQFSVSLKPSPYFPTLCWAFFSFKTHQIVTLFFHSPGFAFWVWFNLKN